MDFSLPSRSPCDDCIYSVYTKLSDIINFLLQHRGDIWVILWNLPCQDEEEIAACNVSLRNRQQGSADWNSEQSSRYDIPLHLAFDYMKSTWCI